jgi:Fur family transcriptional regulator, ferric uptake regulator
LGVIADPAALQERLAAQLLARGMRQTGPRRTVAEAFFSMGDEEHLGLDEIHRRARRRDKRIGYATVYRTMKLLTELGFAHERHFGGGAVRYELAGDGSHHDHLICTNCARIVEFEEPRIESLQDEVARTHGFTIQSHRHEIYGLCDRCRE